MHRRVDVVDTVEELRRRTPEPPPAVALSNHALARHLARQRSLQRCVHGTDGKVTGAVAPPQEEEEGDVYGGMFDESTVTVINRPTEAITDYVSKPDPEVPTDGSLAVRLKGAIALGVGSDKLIVAIRSASLKERLEAGADPAVGDVIHDHLATDHYHEGMALLGITRTGAVAHLTGPDADREVRAKLAEYVGETAKGGAQITGLVSILKGPAWTRAVYKHLERKTPGGEIESLLKTLNAFVHEPYVFICADRGNPGTIIHEAIHKYSKESFQKSFGKALNEGVTEYFTRIVTTKLGIDRDLYETELKGALALAAILKEQGLADAYFGGNAELVKRAVLVRMNGREGDWDTFLKACNKDDPDDEWDKGLALLKG